MERECYAVLVCFDNHRTKTNRAFVVRGSRIGVFKVTDDEKLKFSNTIKKIKNSKGELFSPQKVSNSTQPNPTQNPI